jgi:hypothetical protein
VTRALRAAADGYTLSIGTPIAQMLTGLIIKAANIGAE